jgi:hypothetical protein
MIALTALYGRPFGRLAPEDLIGVAQSMQRAGDLSLALEAVELALAGGAGPEALRVRAGIAKQRGDRVRALADYEACARRVDDPRVRLELAKLYEHHARAPARALAQVARGTGESSDREQHRRRRLERKVERLLDHQVTSLASTSLASPSRVG